MEQPEESMAHMEVLDSEQDTTQAREPMPAVPLLMDHMEHAAQRKLTTQGPVPMRRLDKGQESMAVGAQLMFSVETIGPAASASRIDKPATLRE